MSLRLRRHHKGVFLGSKGGCGGAASPWTRDHHYCPRLSSASIQDICQQLPHPGRIKSKLLNFSSPVSSPTNFPPRPQVDFSFPLSRLLPASWFSPPFLPCGPVSWHGGLTPEHPPPLGRPFDTRSVSVGVPVETEGAVGRLWTGTPLGGRWEGGWQMVLSPSAGGGPWGSGPKCGASSGPF